MYKIDLFIVKTTDLWATYDNTTRTSRETDRLSSIKKQYREYLTAIKGIFIIMETLLN